MYWQLRLSSMLMLFYILRYFPPYWMYIQCLSNTFNAISTQTVTTHLIISSLYSYLSHVACHPKILQLLKQEKVKGGCISVVRRVFLLCWHAMSDNGLLHNSSGVTMNSVLMWNVLPSSSNLVRNAWAAWKLEAYCHVIRCKQCWSWGGRTLGHIQLFSYNIRHCSIA